MTLTLPPQKPTLPGEVYSWPPSYGVGARPCVDSTNHPQQSNLFVFLKDTSRDVFLWALVVGSGVGLVVIKQ